MESIFAQAGIRGKGKGREVKSEVVSAGREEEAWRLVLVRVRASFLLQMN